MMPVMRVAGMKGCTCCATHCRAAPGLLAMVCRFSLPTEMMNSTPVLANAVSTLGSASYSFTLFTFIDRSRLATCVSGSMELRNCGENSLETLGDGGTAGWSRNDGSCVEFIGQAFELAEAQRESSSSSRAPHRIDTQQWRAASAETRCKQEERGRRKRAGRRARAEHTPDEKSESSRMQGRSDDEARSSIAYALSLLRLGLPWAYVCGLDVWSPCVFSFYYSRAAPSVRIDPRLPELVFIGNASIVLPPPVTVSSQPQAHRYQCAHRRRQYIKLMEISGRSRRREAGLKQQSPDLAHHTGRGNVCDRSVTHAGFPSRFLHPDP
ncbi:hypothetical protein ZWY2020_006993 [Hordeum vulgare]|nr:hypothetical protein ZWY2020_006993 [Hordeum vulgare]